MPSGYLKSTPPPGAANRAAAIANAANAALPTGTVLGWLEVPLSSTTGVPSPTQASVSLSQPAEGQAFLVERIDVSTNSSNATTASVQVGGYELDFTPAGNHDVAQENPPIAVPSGAVLSIVWSNCNPGDQCTAVVQYRVVAL